MEKSTTHILVDASSDTGTVKVIIKDADMTKVSKEIKEINGRVYKIQQGTVYATISTGNIVTTVEHLLANGWSWEDQG